MTTRKNKLEKALADLPQRSFKLRGDPLDESSWKWEANPPPEAFWDDGLYVNIDDMNFRLASLHAALIEAVDALEFYQKESYVLKEGWVIAAKEGLCAYASGKQAEEALSKIDKVLADLKE